MAEIRPIDNSDDGFMAPNGSIVEAHLFHKFDDSRGGLVQAKLNRLANRSRNVSRED